MIGAESARAIAELRTPVRLTPDSWGAFESRARIGVRCAVPLAVRPGGFPSETSVVRLCPIRVRGLKAAIEGWIPPYREYPRGRRRLVDEERGRIRFE